MGTRAYSHYISISHRREKIHIFPLIKRVLQCIFFFWGERESGLFLVDKNTYMVRDKLSKKGNPYEHYTNKESRDRKKAYTQQTRGGSKVSKAGFELGLG